MTNILTGQPLTMPTKPAVREHLTMIPILFASLAFICGGVAAANYFGADSPNQKLLLYFNAGLPVLSTLLGQIWQSRNVRNKIAIANEAADGMPGPLRLSDDELVLLERYRAKRDKVAT